MGKSLNDLDEELGEFEEQQLKELAREENKRKARLGWIQYIGAVMGVCGFCILVIYFGHQSSHERDIEKEVRSQQQKKMLFAVWNKEGKNPHDLTFDEFCATKLDHNGWGLWHVKGEE